ncbi:MAG: tRNA (cytidine(34)-2'-O)-methyltransferase [Proteobacteria bacterium]|nr:tRNA (cytidine(34)-2'-O)-methyltransferase [Pseudomonadota bacterium]
MALQIILVHPEIPPNTGNIIRLAANSGADLHLVEPMGFNIDDKQLRRAGLDYHEYANLRVHAALPLALTAAGNGRRFAVTAEGGKRYDTLSYQSDDILLFGSESCGLPADVRQQFNSEQQLYIPMRANNRSLNLSNSVAVVIMEAWRQLNFNGAVR